MAKPVDREISVPEQVEPTAPRDHPFDAEIEAERAGWEELLELIAVRAGAAFVKTSTGFLGSGATVHDVTLPRGRRHQAVRQGDRRHSVLRGRRRPG